MSDSADQKITREVNIDIVRHLLEAYSSSIIAVHGVLESRGQNSTVVLKVIGYLERFGDALQSSNAEIANLIFDTVWALKANYYHSISDWKQVIHYSQLGMSVASKKEHSFYCHAGCAVDAAFKSAEILLGFQLIATAISNAVGNGYSKTEVINFLRQALRVSVIPETGIEGFISACREYITKESIDIDPEYRDLWGHDVRTMIDWLIKRCESKPGSVDDKVDLSN